MLGSRIYALFAGLLLVIPVSGCGVFDTGPSAREVASGFLDAVAAGDAAAAAARTDAPEVARPWLAENRDALDPQSVTTSVREITEGEQIDTASFDASWVFGEGKEWNYRGSLELVEREDGLKVRWSPSAVHPDLAGGQTLDFSEQAPEPAPVLDRDGKSMMSPEPLVTVTLDPRQADDVPKVVDTLAGALGEIDPGITSESIMEGVEKSPGQPYAVVTLRQEDYEKVKSEIHALPGVWFPEKTELVAPERTYGAQVLPGLARHAEKRAAAKTGWRVVTRDADGNEVDVLHDQPAGKAEPLHTVLSDRVQRAAEQAVDPVEKGAMVVAMRPSNGDVLAVAQNEGADAHGPVALTGQYPPGSTFKIVTAAAALEVGATGIDQPVECPAKKTFNGRELPNDKEFELGTVPLHTAFAQSCNTTFAQLAVDRPADALTSTAHKFGVGVDFDMPGAITITGKAPPAEQVVQKAANGIGQGSVVASPFGMALAVSTVVNGSMPTPTLIRGTETKVDSPPEAPSGAVLEQLRPMMREVATSGTASALAGAGDVGGKTGTAQFGDGTHSHGWFVGYRGDLAFAVLITDAGTSKPAVQLARSFLSNTQ
ncbi:penicillin-binding transpeptidase domain-containing protein [Parasphingorhabdus pacifica]